MKVRIEFDTDNAAFEDDWEGEVRRTINDAAGKVARLGPPPGRYRLYDGNGNTIGYAELVDE